MSSTIFDKTDIAVITSALRGEIGDIIETWTLYRDLHDTCQSLRSENIEIDLKNQELLKIRVIKKKLKNQIISALSELAEKKYGQITFSFACNKLGCYQQDCITYQEFIKANDFKSQRNEFISHKNLPPKFEDWKGEYKISNLTIVKAIAKAIILMKNIDKEILGPEFNFMWHTTRKYRYNYTMSGKVKHILLPYKQFG